MNAVKKLSIILTTTVITVAIATVLQGIRFSGESGRFPIKLPVGWTHTGVPVSPEMPNQYACVGPTVIIEPSRSGAPFLTDYGSNCPSHNRLAVILNYTVSLVLSILAVVLVYVTVSRLLRIVRTH